MNESNSMWWNSLSSELRILYRYKYLSFSFNKHPRFIKSRKHNGGYFIFGHCAFRMMHDEVSDTENIRKNLAIERMIVEGCDILLDTSQTFVRQGQLLPVEVLTARSLFLHSPTMLVLFLSINRLSHPAPIQQRAGRAQ